MVSIPFIRSKLPQSFQKAKYLSKKNWQGAQKMGQRIFPVGGGVIKNIVLSLHHGTYKTTSRDPTGRTNRQL